MKRNKLTFDILSHALASSSTHILLCGSVHRRSDGDYSRYMHAFGCEMCVTCVCVSANTSVFKINYEKVISYVLVSTVLSMPCK